jgi:hypothetical protein
VDNGLRKLAVCLRKKKKKKGRPFGLIVFIDGNTISPRSAFNDGKSQLGYPALAAFAVSGGEVSDERTLGSSSRPRVITFGATAKKKQKKRERKERRIRRSGTVLKPTHFGRTDRSNRSFATFPVAHLSGPITPADT